MLPGGDELLCDPITITTLSQAPCTFYILGQPQQGVKQCFVVQEYTRRLEMVHDEFRNVYPACVLTGTKVVDGGCSPCYPIVG